MRRIAAAGLLAMTAACAPERFREFELGLIGPVGPGVASAARAAGMTIREAAPEGAETYAAGVPFAGASGREERRMADWSDLRLLVARAVANGRRGAFFVLPKTAAGQEATSYPEEWQALARVARETAAIRPVLEAGIAWEPPFPAPAGVAARAWRYQGRLYVLLVNDGEDALPVSSDALKPWRALFEVRADARDLLVPCAEGRCLSARRVLWLEGRL